VAKQQTKSGKGGWLLLLLLAAIAAVLYFFGLPGLGLGIGPGTGDATTAGKPEADAADAQPAGAQPDAAEPEAGAPCELRLDPSGLTLGGVPIAIEAAVARCKAGGRARLTVTGDARYGDLVAIRDALQEAGIEVLGL
jgi:hypothetical protein